MNEARLVAAGCKPTCVPNRSDMSEDHWVDCRGLQRHGWHGRIGVLLLLVINCLFIKGYALVC